jgi:hypothetical protein
MFHFLRIGAMRSENAEFIPHVQVLPALSNLSVICVLRREGC